MCFISGTLFSQNPEVKSIPFQFDQFFQTYSLYNPASAGHEAKLEFKAAYSGYTGIRKSIYNTFATLNYCLGDQEDKKHVIGINLFGDVEGKYITRTKIHANYAYHLPLNEQYTLSSGISLGFYNSTVKVNPFIGGGSDITPDANIGFWIYNHTFGGGISYGQLLNNSVTPILETTRLTPFWNLNCYKHIVLGQDWRLKGDAMIRFAKDFNTLLDFALQTNYIDKFTAGLNYRVGESIILFGGLDSYTVNKQRVGILFSYNLSLTGVNLNNSNKYEISVSYYIDKKGVTNSFPIE